jgi:hypothetical protein
MGLGTRRLAELAGLPRWPLLLTDTAAAAYLSLTHSDFTRGVSEGTLPPPRRTPGGDRWARRDLDARFDGPAAESGAQDALGLAIDAWSRP